MVTECPGSAQARRPPRPSANLPAAAGGLSYLVLVHSSPGAAGVRPGGWGVTAWAALSSRALHLRRCPAQVRKAPSDLLSPPPREALGGGAAPSPGAGAPRVARRAALPGSWCPHGAGAYR